MVVSIWKKFALAPLHRFAQDEWNPCLWPTKYMYHTLAGLEAASVLLRTTLQSNKRSCPSLAFAWNFLALSLEDTVYLILYHGSED